MPPTSTMERFVPALIVVDMQEDFCPPNGPLQVAGGREIALLINKMLELPFAVKIATQDWHPANSKTFASQHDGKSPFTDSAEFKNPDNPSQTMLSTVWPDHCVQDSHGSKLIPELDMHKIEVFLHKGIDAEVETYSAFGDMFNRKGPGITDLDLAALLHEKKATHVYVAGLAGDVCVKCTAIDAAKEGFKTYVVWDCVKSVTKEGGEKAKAELEQVGVQIIQSSSKEVKRVGL